MVSLAWQAETAVSVTLKDANGETLAAWDDRLRISYDVDTSVSDEPTKAEIRVYNPSVRFPLRDAAQVELYATLGLRSGRVLLGQVTDARVVWEGVTSYALIRAEARFAPNARLPVSLNFPRPVPLTDIFTIALALAKLPKPFDLAKLLGDRRAAFQGVTSVTQLAAAFGLRAVADSGNFDIYEGSTRSSATEYALVDEGIVGKPSVRREEEDGSEEYEAVSLYRPDLELGGLVRVRDYGGDEYAGTLTRLRHTGDSANGSLRTTLTIAASFIADKPAPVIDSTPAHTAAAPVMERLKDVHTVSLGLVTEYDETAQSVNAQPVFDVMLADGSLASRPELIGVPLLSPAGIRHELAAGDLVALLFTSRTAQALRGGDGAFVPPTSRLAPTQGRILSGDFALAIPMRAAGGVTVSKGNASASVTEGQVELRVGATFLRVTDGAITASGAITT